MNQQKINKIIKDYESGLSMAKTGEKNGVSSWVVDKTLRENNIPKRTFKEASKIQYQHKDRIELSINNYQILVGNLLGDGSVLRKKKRAFYAHTDKNREYLEWLRDELEKDGISFSPICQNQASGCWVLQSHTFGIFNEFRDRFYMDGKRILPQDIALTPLTLRQWYISDGSVTTHGGRLISRRTDDGENMLNQLRLLFGDEVTQTKQGYYIPVKYVKNFLEYIGDSPVDSYKYKWKM